MDERMARMTRKDAITYFEERQNYNPHNGNPDAERLAISALREQEERESKKWTMKGGEQ